jgi:hypothetical protein
MVGETHPGFVSSSGLAVAQNGAVTAAAALMPESRDAVATAGSRAWSSRTWSRGVGFQRGRAPAPISRETAIRIVPEVRCSARHQRLPLLRLTAL